MLSQLSQSDGCHSRLTKLTDSHLAVFVVFASAAKFVKEEEQEQGVWRGEEMGRKDGEIRGQEREGRGDVKVV